MISADGTYWTTGITVTYREGKGWSASLDYFDDGFLDDTDSGTISTQGTLYTRYEIPDGVSRSGLAAAIDVLIADAHRLGIRFGTGSGVCGVGPRLYYRGDGEDPTFPPPNGWRDMLATEAKRIGWAA